MKVSREKAAENRARIVDTASALLREHGFDGIGVADLMRAAGLTHGGFYGHFASKDELAAEACGQALARSAGTWAALAERDGVDGFATLVDRYLAVSHRDGPGRGCVLASLGMEGPRQSPTVRQSLAAGMRALLDALGRLVPGRTATMRRHRALAALSAMTGAVMLSRLADDPQLSKDVLDAVAAELKAWR
ncbi:MAG: TetR/AcrR family transcriptional regulator [Alphaproteobacteria bacterium]